MMTTAVLFAAEAQSAAEGRGDELGCERVRVRTMRTSAYAQSQGPTARFIPAQGNALGSDSDSGEPCRGDPMDRPYRAHMHMSHSLGRCPRLGSVGPLALFELLSHSSLRPSAALCVSAAGLSR